MRVPDYISPVVAYRAWQLDANGLKSALRGAVASRSVAGGGMQSIREGHSA